MKGIRVLVFFIVLLVITILIALSYFLLYHFYSLFPFSVKIYNYDNTQKSVYLFVNNSQIATLLRGDTVTINVKNKDKITSSYDSSGTENVNTATINATLITKPSSLYIFEKSLVTNFQQVKLKITNTTSSNYYISPTPYGMTTNVISSSKSVTVYTYLGDILNFGISTNTINFSFAVLSTKIDSIKITTEGITT